jgi:hypothetical protein
MMGKTSMVVPLVEVGRIEVNKREVEITGTVMLEVPLTEEFVIPSTTIDVSLRETTESFMPPFSRLRVLKPRVLRINSNKQNRATIIFTSCSPNPN